MKKISTYLVIFFLLSTIFISLPFTPFNNNIAVAENNWVISGNTVYVDDALVYASATPHTISGSGDVVFEFKSKVYTGNVDFIWGFYQEIMKPTAIWLWQNYSHPYNVQEYVQDWGSVTLNSVTSYTSLGIQNYSLYTVTLGNRNNTYLYRVNYGGNKTEIFAFTTFSNVGSTFTLSGNYSHWVNVVHSSTYPDWNSWTSPYTKLNFNYGGMNTWYLYENQPIVSGNTYKCKIRIEQRFGVNDYSGKYWFAFKPSTETLGEAIANNHFYALDPWFNTSWSKCKRIVIDHTKVAGDLTNFPILFDNTSASFKTYAQADGDDFVFVKPDNVTRYNHEIESYNKTTGQLVAWVNITSLSSTDDTILYLYYGNAGCTNQQNIAGTWNKDYKAVFHLNQGGAIDRNDSTSWNYDLTPVNYDGDEKVVGVAGNADRLDGGNDVLNNADTTHYLDSVGGTMEIWFYSHSAGAGARGLMAKTQDSHGGWTFYTVSAPNYVRTAYWNAHWHELEPTHTFSINTWYYVAMTRGTGGMKEYKQGAEFGSNALDHTFVEQIGAVGQLEIGSYNSNPSSGFFDGTLDEARISLVQRSAQWINTTYNTIYYKSTFLSVSSTTASMTTAPSDLAVTAHTNTTISLSWNKGTNQTVILRNTTGFSSSYKWGTVVYNGTLQVFTDTLLTAGKKYYYKAWNFNPYTKTFSTNSTNVSDYTNPNPPNTVKWTALGSGNINISWVNGTGTNKTILRYSTTAQPTTPTSGTEIYNGTGKYKVQAVTGTFWVTLFSLNTTSHYFSTGVNLTSYFVYINCYDEDTGEKLQNYTVFFFNPSGTETFAKYPCLSPCIVNTTDLPLGDDISLVVNKSGYSTRTYIFDIISTGNYYIEVYLTKNNTLYLITIVNPNSVPISNVKITITKYINATVGFENVSISYTDGGGQITVYLQPFRLYKFHMNHSGYKEGVSDWIPSDVLFTHTFMMEFLDSEVPPDFIEPTFTAVRVGTDIHVNYTDSMVETVDTTVFFYFINATTGDETLIIAITNTSQSSLHIVLTGTNLSLEYKVVIWYNHTSYGFQIRFIIIPRASTPLTTPATLNALLVAIIGPAGPFIWTNVITWLAFTVMMFHADRKDAGKYLILIGGVMAFVAFIGFVNFYAGIVPVLFIAVGILIEWINARRA